MYPVYVPVQFPTRFGMLAMTGVAGVVDGADVAGLNDVHPAHIMIPIRSILKTIHFIVKLRCYMG